MQRGAAFTSITDLISTNRIVRAAVNFAAETELFKEQKERKQVIVSEGDFDEGTKPSKSFFICFKN